MRLGYALLGAVALLLVGLLAAALLLPYWIDPGTLRDEVQRLATEQLNSTVAFDGPVELRMLPRPVLRAGRVSLLHGNPGDPDALAVTAASLTARLDLPALWHGRFATDTVVLDRANVQAPLPFDIRALTAGRPAALRSASIWLRQARVRIGPVVANAVDARLRTDRSTGDVTLSGTFRLPNREGTGEGTGAGAGAGAGAAWRASLALGRPGGDGAAALDASLEERDQPDGIAAKLTGQVAGDGGFAGRVTAGGPDLSRLIAAPPLAFTLDGRASLAGGIAALDDAAVTLGGVPARLDASLRLPPQARLEARLNTSRIDLDAWRRAVGRATSAPLPFGLDLTAEAASLGGGALRQLHVEADLDGGRVDLRSAQATVPGGMAVQLTGAVDLAAATSQLDIRVDGDDLRATAGWLGAMAGQGVGGSAPAPPAALRRFSGRATLDVSGAELEAHDIAARLDGVGLHGDVLLSAPQGGRPSAAAILTFDQLDLVPWLAGWGDIGWPWPGLDGSLQLTTARALLPGFEAALQGDLTLRDGALDVTRLDLGGPRFTLRATGARSAEGRWSDASLALAADHLADLAPALPEAARAALARWPGVSDQPLHATLLGSGTVSDPSASLVADLGALHVEATGSSDVLPGQWRGGLLLHHPSAAGLAASFGWPAGFVGEGSLAASTDAHWNGGALELDDLAVRAGLLELGGTLRLDLAGPVPALGGALQAPVLMLPAVDWRAATPLPLWLLRGWSAGVDLTAERVEGLGVGLSDLRAHLALAGGALDLTGLVASLPGGGALTGQITLDARPAPPHATVDAAFEGARLAAQPWQPLDLLASGVAGTVQLDASGYAPAAMLATLRGAVRATAASASLVGMDVGRLGGDLSDAAVRAALSGGRTTLDSTALAADIDAGLASLSVQAAASGGAHLDATGSVDLPDRSVDLGIAVTPGIADPPRIAVRLIGPIERATLTPALGDLARWRALHP